MRSGFGREYGLCKRLPGGVGDWDAGGVKDFVRGWREALLCLSSTSRLDCHLSGMSCSCICSSWPWLRKEQSSEVRRYSCSLTPTVTGALCPPRDLWSLLSAQPGALHVCLSAVPSLLSLPCALPLNCRAELSKPPLPKIISCFRGWKM